MKAAVQDITTEQSSSGFHKELKQVNAANVQMVQVQPVCVHRWRRVAGFAASGDPLSTGNCHTRAKLPAFAFAFASASHSPPSTRAGPGTLSVYACVCVLVGRALWTWTEWIPFRAPRQALDSPNPSTASPEFDTGRTDWIGARFNEGAQRKTGDEPPAVSRH